MLSFYYDLYFSIIFSQFSQMSSFSSIQLLFSIFYFFLVFLVAQQLKKYLCPSVCLPVCLPVPDFEFRHKIVFTKPLPQQIYCWQCCGLVCLSNSSCYGLESPINFIIYCYCDGRRLDRHPTKNGSLFVCP